MAHLHMMSVTDIMKQQVAHVMSQWTPYTISAKMVNPVKGENHMNIFSAQVGDVTVLCKVSDDGYIVKTVRW